VARLLALGRSGDRNRPRRSQRHPTGTPGGVVVIMDLGSVVLSAEMAVEFAWRAARGCQPGARVEGSIAAAVLAGAGADPTGFMRK
jgi:dihydroxyacetone kinase DhaKLM complex PTS-EIIA-like component DhaM